MTLKSRIDSVAARLSGRRLRCSFCHKTQDEVAQLIAGPSVFICNECVDICNGVLAEERRKAGHGGNAAVPAVDAQNAPDAEAADPAAPTQPIGDVRAMPTERLLLWLKFQEDLLEQSRAGLQEAVDTLREREVSWAAIGEALGVSRQAAWERFS